MARFLLPLALVALVAASALPSAVAGRYFASPQTQFNDLANFLQKKYSSLFSALNSTGTVLYSQQHQCCFCVPRSSAPSTPQVLYGAVQPAGTLAGCPYARHSLITTVLLLCCSWGRSTLQVLSSYQALPTAGPTFVTLTSYTSAASVLAPAPAPAPSLSLQAKILQNPYGRRASGP